MCGDRHDRAGAVAHQHVVGNEDRNLLSVNRIRRERPGEDTRLLLVLLTLEIRLRRDRRAIVLDRLGGRRRSVGPSLVDCRALGSRRPRVGGEHVDQRVFRGEHHVGGAEQGVGSRGEDVDRHLAIGLCRDARYGELHLGAARTPDPVALHGLDLLGPVQHLEVVEQAVGVRGDAHHPLPQVLAEHREVSAVTSTVGGDLFVGEHRAETRRPVDERITQVDKTIRVDDVGLLGDRQISPHPTVVESACTAVEFGDQLVDATRLACLVVVPGVVDLQEDPLCPAVERDVGGGNTTSLVVPESEASDLAEVALDVGLGRRAGVSTGLHRVLLGR